MYTNYDLAGGSNVDIMIKRIQQLIVLQKHIHWIQYYSQYLHRQDRICTEETWYLMFVNTHNETDNFTDKAYYIPAVFELTYMLNIVAYSKTWAL